MKLSTSLLQAIALGISVTAVTATTTSCEKEKIECKVDRTPDNSHEPATDPHACPACGMG